MAPPRSSVRALNLALGVTAAVLAVSVIRSWPRRAAHDLPGGEGENGPHIGFRERASREIPPSRFVAIEQRDLFHPDRRPPPADDVGPGEPAATTAPGFPSTKIDLLGVVLAGTERVALLDGPSLDEGPVQVGVGATLAGFTVVRVDADAVLLETETGATHLLELNHE